MNAKAKSGGGVGVFESIPAAQPKGGKSHRRQSTTFPIGAWVRDPEMKRLSDGIERDPVSGRVRFTPYAGEIIGTGLLCKIPVYRVQFGDSRGFVFVDDAECYQCHSRDDDSHAEFCPDKALRAIPHEPGYYA